VLTEAPTNHGDSGGPVVNDAGELVGVTQGCKPNVSLQNFAIDVSEVRAFLNASAWMGNVTTAKEYARRARHYFADPTLESLPPRNHRFEAALADVNAAIRLDPKNPDYYIERARINEQESRYFRNINVLSSLPGAATGPLVSLNLLMAQSDLRTAQRLDPDNARAWARLGSLAHSARGADGMATEQLKKAIAIDPDCIEAYEELVSIDRAGNPKRAIGWLGEILRIDPTNSAALVTRANLHAGERRFDAALRDYDRALRLCPNRPEYFQGRAAVYKAMNKLDAARSDLITVALRLAPENVSNWSELGDLLAGNGNLKGAITAYSQALAAIAEFKIENALPEKLHLARGKILAIAGAPKEAREDFEKALQIARENRVRDPQFEKEVSQAINSLSAVSMNN
jgi:tetratricopeptide (TPR) repeat protein